jgi:hypothetical protein
MKNFFLASLILLSFCLPATAQEKGHLKLESGDLIFQDLDCGGMCDAIESVTRSYSGYHFSHIGLVHRTGDKVMVIEAAGAGVREIPLDSFARRTANPMLVGRVKDQYKKTIDKAIDFSIRQLGIPYDDAFLYNNGKYYCSELIYDAFKYANDNQPFFQLEPMTFKEPGSDQYFPVWVDYYKKLEQAIPEGAPGCNPGGLSRSEKINIIGKF